jgi:hypothetical protein
MHGIGTGLGTATIPSPQHPCRCHFGVAEDVVALLQLPNKVSLRFVSSQEEIDLFCGVVKMYLGLKVEWN